MIRKHLVGAFLATFCLLGSSSPASAGDSDNYYHDESQNRPFPNSCQSDSDCDGARRCHAVMSSAGAVPNWCEGRARATTIATPQGLPSGGYTGSCRNISVGPDGNLHASCANQRRDWVDTQLSSPWSCKGEIQNEDGNLVCEQ